MRPVHVHRLLIPLLAALAATAHAESSKTREEVQAEMIDARRSGDVIANGESGLTLRELYPQRYPAVTVAGKTREQVVAELKEAQRTGDILAGGELAVPLNQAYPSAYPPKIMLAGKSRAQVQAELREAIRTGDMLADGDSGMKLKELYPQRYANIAPMATAPMHAASSPSVVLR